VTCIALPDSGFRAVVKPESLAAWLAEHHPLRYGIYPLVGTFADLRITAADGAVFHVRGPEPEITELASMAWNAIRDAVS
jgi:hypothetical protein